MSDDGRTAVYAAEEAAFGGTALDDDLTATEVEELVRRVVDGAWWSSSHGPPVELRPVRAGTTSSASSGPVAGDVVVVRIATARPGTVTHELAHALAGARHGHDPTFRVAHVDVVAATAGRDAADMLRLAFAEHGVPAGRRHWPAPFRHAGPGFVVL